MKAENKKSSPIKTVAIIAAATVAILLCAAFLFALPNINANNKLDYLKEIVASQELGDVVVYLHTPFETGSFDQVTSMFEKKLNGNEKEEFSSLFSSVSDSAKYNGTSNTHYAMTDYKIRLTVGEENIYFYASSDSIYILNGRMRIEYETEDSALFDYLEKLKNSHFE